MTQFYLWFTGVPCLLLGFLFLGIALMPPRVGLPVLLMLPIGFILVGCLGLYLAAR